VVRGSEACAWPSPPCCNQEALSVIIHGNMVMCGAWKDSVPGCSDVWCWLATTGAAHEANGHVWLEVT
jgi:hypothetical protein